MRYACLFIIILLFSCKKHEIVPIPKSNEPVFKITGTIDNMPVSFVAGENNFKLSNEIITSNGVSIFSARMSNSEQSFEMQLFDGNIDKSSNRYDSLLQVKSLSFVPVVSAPLFQITKNDFPNSDQISSIKWTIQNQQDSYINTLQLFNPGKYTVCAEVSYIDNTRSYLCEEIIAGYKRRSDFNLKLNPVDNVFTVQAQAFKGTPSSFEWYVDGVRHSSEENTILIENDNQQHTVRSKVSFPETYPKEKSLIVDASGSNKHLYNFGLSEYISSVFYDFTVNLQYIEKGIIYTSRHEGNTENIIRIISSEPYGISDKGNPVYKVKGQVEASLKALSSNVIKPLNLYFTIGIEIPK